MERRLFYIKRSFFQMKIRLFITCASHKSDIHAYSGIGNESNL
jgi:hypothetical protein